MRLSTTADGGSLHDLKVIASRSIRSRPKVFFSVATTEDLSEQILAGVLVVVGEEYVDRPLARRYELEARYKALRGLKPDGESPVLDGMLASL